MKKLTVTRDHLLAIGEGESLVEHLFVSAIANVCKENLVEFLKDIDWDNKKEIECYMVVEGHQIPIDTVCDEWNKQAEKMIREKALELLEEKLSDIQNIAFDIAKQMRIKAKNKLGIKLDDYGE